AADTLQYTQAFGGASLASTNCQVYCAGARSNSAQAVTSVTALGRFAPHCAANTSSSAPKGPRAMTMVKILVLGSVLAAVAITLKVRVDTPQGPQPLPRAIMTTHLQQLQGELALP